MLCTCQSQTWAAMLSQNEMQITLPIKAPLVPSPGFQHFHWFPLGSDLHHQGQASDRNELCRLLHKFGTIFCDSLHICIYATSSHILTCNVKKCYMDYFLCRPIYAYPYTINLMYYNTMVLIMKNYFSHQTSELGISYCKCQADLMWYCFLHFSCVILFCNNKISK